ncbi:MAG TPA: hypothetical protein VFW94_20525 [Candidatus Acidoferrales bacterium]|nr:hypothetical protein [Candidatus Acidoferrales bacterium]
MKRVAQFACLLMILGIVAVAAHADSTTGTVAPPDPKVILNDPSCPQGAYCVNLTYTGRASATYTSDDPLEFLTPQPVPDGLSYTCGSDTPSITCQVIVSQPPPVQFLGAYFWGMTLSPGEVVTIGSQGGYLDLDLPSDFVCTDGGCTNGVIDLTPEPSTAILYFLGFGLLFACTKRRCGFSSQA